MLTRERAFILKIKPFREGHLLVTLLTEKRGVLRALAQKAQFSNSPLHASCQPFVEADFLLRVSTKSMATILQSEIIDPHSILRFDYSKAGFAAACSEWIRQVAGEEGLTIPSAAFHCLENGLSWIENGSEPALAYLRFLSCALSEVGISLAVDELFPFKLSSNATELLIEMIENQGLIHADVHYSRDSVYELLEILSLWIFDQTGIVLKSLKLAIQLSGGVDGDSSG